jgi:hypothetical protein
MKKYPLLLASLLFAAFAAPVHAADADKSGMGMNKMDMDKMDMDKMSDHHMTMGMTGMHKMTGTVEKLDQAKGTLMLKTGVGDLMLHFPPPALKDVKNGDTITVQLGFHKESAKK